MPHCQIYHDPSPYLSPPEGMELALWLPPPGTYQLPRENSLGYFLFKIFFLQPSPPQSSQPQFSSPSPLTQSSGLELGQQIGGGDMISCRVLSHRTRSQLRADTPRLPRRGVPWGTCLSDRRRRRQPWGAGAGMDTASGVERLPAGPGARQRMSFMLLVVHTTPGLLFL